MHTIHVQHLYSVPTMRICWVKGVSMGGRKIPNLKYADDTLFSNKRRHGTRADTPRHIKALLGTST